LNLFAKKKILYSILKTIGIKERDENIVFLWLKCSKKTSIMRKKGVVKPSIVERQWKRYAKRYKPYNEMPPISTDNKTIDEIVACIMDFIS